MEGRGSAPRGAAAGVRRRRGAGPGPTAVLLQGPQVYVVNFTTVGVQTDGVCGWRGCGCLGGPRRLNSVVFQGHELMLHESWIGQLLYSSPVYDSANGTGIILNSNDHCKHSRVFCLRLSRGGPLIELVV